MKSAQLIVDVNSLYRSAKKKFNNRTVDYNKLDKMLNGLGFKYESKIAFMPELGTKSQGFVSILRQLGFEIRTKPAVLKGGHRETVWDVEIAVEALKSDLPLVLCSSRPTMIPVLQVKETTVVSAWVPKQMQNHAEIVEIKEEVLRDGPAK